MSHAHPHSPAHVRFDVVKEETDVDISARDKALEATIQHARELSSPRHSLLAHAAALREPSAAAYLSSSDSFSSLPVDEDPSPYPVLCSLLSSSSTFHIEYKGSLSNHLPHALISLYHLGASSRRLMAYSALYSERLEPARGLEEERWEAPWDEAEHRGRDDDDVTDSNHNSVESRGRRSRSEPVVIAADNWQRFLGHKRHFLSYARFFQAELQQRIDEAQKRPPSPSLPAAAQMETEGSAEDVVQSSLTAAQTAALQSLVSTYAPLLIAGGSHSALHPLIHTGWGQWRRRSAQHRPMPLSPPLTSAPLPLAPRRSLRRRSRPAHCVRRPRLPLLRLPLAGRTHRRILGRVARLPPAD